ncbi:MAG: hypothetical protein ACE5I3_04300 [Phycisphaerae bacterium]
MAVLQPPKSILAKPVECMVVEPTTHALQLFIREDPVKLGDYPHPCSVDIRLPAWDYQPVVAIALLVCVARRWRLICQTWINPARLEGIRILGNLTKEGRIYVHIVTDRVRRTIRVPNVVKRDASRLRKTLSARPCNWSDESFEEARQQIDTLYPTPARLWRACVTDSRFAS